MSHITGARGSQDLRSPSLIMAPVREYYMFREAIIFLEHISEPVKEAIVFISLQLVRNGGGFKNWEQYSDIPQF